MIDRDPLEEHHPCVFCCRERIKMQMNVPQFDRVVALGVLFGALLVANSVVEALHALIGRMLNSAASLKKVPASDTGVAQLLAVLHDYQSTFNHPGWVPVATHVN